MMRNRLLSGVLAKNHPGSPRLARMNIICRVLLVFCLYLLLKPTVLFAIDSNSRIFQQEQTISNNIENTVPPLGSPEDTQITSPGILYTLGKIILSLVLIIAVIYITLWGLKFVWERRGLPKQFDEEKPIKILASNYLAPKKAIYLVEVGNKVLVLGVGPEKINCLDVITSPEEVEALKFNPTRGFQNIFNRAIQKHEGVQKGTETKNIFEDSNKAMGGYLKSLKNIIKVKDDKKDKPEDR